MKKKIFTAVGLMSGTSMDGVDLSLIKTDGYSQYLSILNNYFEFDNELQKKLINLREKIFTENDLEKYSNELNDIERKITLFHSQIMNDVLNNYNKEIDLIGFHGQTIFHDSKKKNSRQLGDAKLLSQITKKIIVSNFRQNDLINGGQGAPLTPIFHRLISNSIAKKNKISFPLNILNIGGISNLTQIVSDNSLIDTNLFASDIGPGNCLIDEWVRKNSNKKFDNNGELARSGKVNDLVFNQAIDNFSKDFYERSLDIKDFDIIFAKGLSLEDGCATLTKFTAYLIAQGIEHMNSSNKLQSVNNLVCGGGRKNSFLMKNIIDNFKNKKVELTNIDKYGFDGDYIESQCFAYLAVRKYLELPISFPSTTGCKNPTIGGKVNKNF